jgi:hypothetical protein
MGGGALRTPDAARARFALEPNLEYFRDRSLGDRHSTGGLGVKFGVAKFLKAL